MSVLYGDEGIRHRLTDSQAKVLVTNAENADRIDRSLVEHVLILDDALLSQGSSKFQCIDTAADDPQLDFLSRHEVANVFGTPTAIRSMMSIGDAGTRYPQKFRIVCSAGEPLNPEAIRWFRQQYNVTVLDYYGLTESYPLCANFPFMEVREGSMGKPMPGWQVAILDEDERPVASGERGEIWFARSRDPHLQGNDSELLHRCRG
jgi:acyl-coenzyme A synthetase/AMP-(fatty) acid ligase